MRRADWLVVSLGIILAAIVLIPSPGNRMELSAQESGSVERPFPRVIPFDPVPIESGSTERGGRGIPVPDGQESGSVERHIPPGPIDPDSFPPDEGKTVDGSTDAGGAAVAKDGQASPTSIEFKPPNLIVPVVLFLAGLFLVAWTLFRMGLFNPYTANIWPKRLELCIEIALRMDDFMTALNEKKFEKCQMSLDALNHLNGRRSILLSNEINAAVNRFTESAVSAKVSQDDEEFRSELNRRYEKVIEALRTGTRQKELSLEVLRSLTKAQGPHRTLLESPTVESAG